LAWTAIGTALGATAALATSYAAARLGLAAAISTLRAAHFSLDHGATTALRGAGASALLTDAIGLAAVVALPGLLFLLGGGGTLAGPLEGGVLLRQATAVLPGVAAGTVVVALVLSSGGSAYRLAAQHAGRVPPFVDACNPRSPAMVAEMVGEHVGTSVRRTTAALAATTLGTTGLLLLGAAALGTDAEPLGVRAWALVSLPLVARAIGLFATAFGVLASRLREGERPTRAIWRGQAAAALLVAGGLLGASTWLLGPDYAACVTAAASLGMAGGIGASHLSRRRTDRRLPALQETLGAERLGPAIVVIRGLAIGFTSALLPVLTLAAAVFAGIELGIRSGLDRGAFFAGAATLIGVMAGSGFVLVMGLFGPIAGGARVLSSFEPEATGADPRRRTALLDDAAFEASGISDSYCAVLSGCATLLATLALGKASAAASLPLPPALLVGCGLVGSAFVSLLVGHAVAVAARSAGAATLEVDRQLKGFPREAGVPVVPRDFTPSYRAVVDLTGHLAARGTVLPTLAALAAPVALGMGLRLLYKSPGSAAEGVTAFVAFAAATGVGVSFLGAGARAVLGAAHRASRPRGASAGFEASLAGHSVGEFLGSYASPLIQLFANGTAVAALLIAPALARL